MTPAGTVTRFALPADRTEPGQIIAGGDGNLWFTAANALGRITPAGEITMVELATTIGGASITAGPDGAVWFAANSLGDVATVGRVDAGRVPRVTDAHDLPIGAHVRGIVAGADGNLWVAENGPQSIARVTPGGQVTQYTLAPERFPELMVAGKDGAVWFTVLSPRQGGGVDRFQIPA
jgi:virginiamycin B lyase